MTLNLHYGCTLNFQSTALKELKKLQFCLILEGFKNDVTGMLQGPSELKRNHILINCSGFSKGKAGNKNCSSSSQTTATKTSSLLHCLWITLFHNYSHRIKWGCSHIVNWTHSNTCTDQHKILLLTGFPAKSIFPYQKGIVLPTSGQPLPPSSCPSLHATGMAHRGHLQGGKHSTGRRNQRLGFFFFFSF